MSAPSGSRTHVRAEVPSAMVSITAGLNWGSAKRHTVSLASTTLRISASRAAPGAIERVVARTERADADPADLERWHEVRKAAKAVRYACEAMEASVPGLSDEVTAWEAVTESLGELQDTAVASDLIVQVARRSGADPDTGAWRVLRDAQSDRRRAAFAEGQLALAAVLDRRP